MTRVKGVIQLLIAAALVALIVWTNVIPDEGRRIEDAIYLDDAQVLAENEGKRVIIAGTLRAGEGARDPDLGLAFADSPVARRVVERLDWVVDKWEWKTIYDYSTDSDLKEATFAGTGSIGQFDLDADLLKRLPGYERDWSEEEVASQVPSGWRLDYAGSQLYLTNADTFVLSDDYNLYSDLEGSYRVRYRLWNSSEGLEATVVGIQRGTTLCYDPDLNATSTFEGIMDKDELVETNGMYVLLGEIIFAAVPVALLVFFGVRNVRDL